MANLKINPTPSTELVKAAVSEIEIKDSVGRTILLRKPGVLAQFRLVKILGETAQNRVYMNMVMPLIFVASIDGDAVAFPNSEREVEGLIQRLDEHGVSAVMEAVHNNFGVVDPEKANAEIKN